MRARRAAGYNPRRRKRRSFLLTLSYTVIASFRNKRTRDAQTRHAAMSAQLTNSVAA